MATDVKSQGATFSIIDTKPYVAVVTLSTQDNGKLLEQLKSGFKKRVNWNKHQSKISTERPNQYLDSLTDPNFQGVNRPLVLSLEHNAHQTSYKRYFLATVKIKYYKFMISEQDPFNQPIKNNLRIYDSI